jgi:hypothetical protein
MLAFIQNQHRDDAKAVKTYAEQPVPLFLLSRMIRNHRLAAVGLLAATDGATLHCCAGNPEEWAAAVGALEGARSSYCSPPRY